MRYKTEPKISNSSLLKPFGFPDGSVVLVINVECSSVRVINETPPKCKQGVAVFQQLLPDIYCVKLPKQPTQVHQLGILKEIEQFRAGLQCTIKAHWNNRYRVSGNRAFVLKHQPLGDFFNQVFVLCEKCHSRQDLASTEIFHANAYRWFHAWAWQWLSLGVSNAFYSLEDNGNPRETEGTTKRAFVRDAQTLHYNASKKLLNPFTPEQGNLYKLMAVAIALCGEPNSDFRKADYPSSVTFRSKQVVNKLNYPEP